MPAKKVITKELIVKTAIKMLEEKGIDEINARSLAQALNSSTQPIYLSFKSMDELKEVLLNECRNVYNSYIEEALKNESNLFMGYLFSYIKFASEYPRLFEYLYMKNKYKSNQMNEEFKEHIIEGICRAGGYSKETAYKFYLQSWIYAHGFATQFVTGYTLWSMDVVREFMEDEFEALKKEYKGR